MKIYQLLPILWLFFSAVIYSMLCLMERITLLDWWLSSSKFGNFVIKIGVFAIHTTILIVIVELVLVILNI